MGDVVVAVPNNDKGLAEYYVAEADAAVRLPEKLADSEVSLLIQPLSTVIYGLDRLGDISGRRVLVVGLGPIGILATWLLHKRGAGQILGVDPIAWRCLAAENAGADETFAMASENLLHWPGRDALREVPDICVEAVGHQTTTLNDCLYLVKRCGTVLALGVPDIAIYPFDFGRFFRWNLHLIGSVTPPWQEYLKRALTLVLRHQDELGFLITHRFSIHDAEAAFSMYEWPAGHPSLKVMLDGSGW